jgi:hypothetical protein
MTDNLDGRKQQSPVSDLPYLGIFPRYCIVLYPKGREGRVFLFPIFISHLISFDMSEPESEAGPSREESSILFHPIEDSKVGEEKKNTTQ